MLSWNYSCSYWALGALAQFQTRLPLICGEVCVCGGGGGFFMKTVFKMRIDRMN